MSDNTNYFDLYKALKADGAVQGDWNSFHKFVGAPGKQGYLNRKKLYDALKADGAVQSSTYEEFNMKLFRGGQASLKTARQRNAQPTKAQTPVQPVKKQTMKERAQEVAAQYQQTKPMQQKPQQPGTATASGTDYMKNWQLMHMRNDQMNPMQQAQANNMRTRMQNANAFGGKLQQFNTPEARRARAKQQRVDDARAFAKKEVENENYLHNDGKTITRLGDDLLDLVDSSMNEAQNLTRKQYQENLNKVGGFSASQYAQEKAFRDAQTQEQVNRQNILMNNLSKKIGEVYSQEDM